ncbi:hypothetical protein HPP92_028671 [Vanilla planifolia]|uniref:Uncharacterized protein n=1 Tax=Vanilla planifolia TaxID=51239 RepID=A0A835PA42_VANPL|nr:hypothetical protein HPP92_028671 [Vanilla planifolia]
MDVDPDEHDEDDFAKRIGLISLRIQLKIPEVQLGGYSVIFEEKKYTITNKATQQIMAVTEMTTNKLFPLEISSVEEKVMAVKLPNPSEIWHWTPSASERISDELEFSKRRSSLRLRSIVEMDASDLRNRLTKQRRLNVSSYIKSDGHSYWNRYHTHNSYGDTRRLPERTISNWLRGRIKFFKPFAWENRVKCFSMISSGFQGRLGGRFGGKAAENFHYNARKMGRKEKAGDAANPLDFAGPRSLVELRGARADATKNIDSISSPEPESKKCLKEAELLGYDVSVSFEATTEKEENEGLHSRRDAHKGNFENYDRIGVDQPKVETCAKEEALNHANDDVITPRQHAIGDETEPWYSNPIDGGCEGEAGVDYKRKYDITGCMDVDPDEHNEEDDFAKRLGLIYS